jgi:hypothetical protein
MRVCAWLSDCNLSAQGSSYGPRTSTVTMEEMQTLEPGQDERAKVHGWRLHVLLEAGYPIDVAERLAESDVDLHTAVDLVEQGCSHHTAAAILL